MDAFNELISELASGIAKQQDERYARMFKKTLGNLFPYPYTTYEGLRIKDMNNAQLIKFIEFLKTDGYKFVTEGDEIAFEELVEEGSNVTAKIKYSKIEVKIYKLIATERED